jgi:hypothetical protein
MRASAVPGLAAKRSSRPYHSVMPGADATDGPSSADIRPLPHGLADLVEDGLRGPGRNSGRVVVGSREAREAVHEHERGDPVGMRGRGHQRHLHGVTVRDHRGVLGAGGVHHRRDVVHPVLGRGGRGGRGERVGQPDSAHVEPEDARIACERAEQLLDERLLPEHLEVTCPVQ